jgi:3-dehydroquinate dehydratase-1
VKGRTIGGRAPLVCLPLVAADRVSLLEQAEDLLPLDPDLLEWRVDGFTDIDASLEALNDLTKTIDPVPLIYTCRIDLEGGMSTLARDKRLTVIESAIDTGLVDIVDIELCNDAVFIETILAKAAAKGTKVILSFHDFDRTPEESAILERLQRAQEMGADIAKVAVMPKNYQDVLVLLGATLKARSGLLEIPIVTMSMGAEGVVTRLAGGLFGADITFAIGKNASAPGQIPIGKLRQAMAVLYS